MQKPWLRFYDNGVPPSIDYQDISLPLLFEQAVEKYSEKTAIIFGDVVGGRLLERKISYRELSECVNRFANALQTLGVRKGDRVALYLPNCPQFVIAYYAALKIGGIIVPCNPLFVARELQHQLQDSGTKILISLTHFHKNVKQARPKSQLDHVIYTNIKEYFPAAMRFIFTTGIEKKQGHRITIRGEDNTHWWQKLIAGNPASLKPVKTTPDDTAVLMYTGGTTGTPKGAKLCHRNLASNAMMAKHWVHAKRGAEVILTALPLFHSYGMTICMNFSILSGGRMVLIPNPRKTDFILKAIQKYRVTLFPGVPTMYVAINNYPKIKNYNLSSIRVCMSGAAPMPIKVQERFQKLTGAKLMEGYGLSEASPVTHANPLGRNRVGAIGIPWPDTDARIVDIETGKKELPVGEIGELVVRGPQVMKGYWNMPEETAAALRDGWLYTGDIASMDEDGYYQIVDRKKDMIISGGFNIYPRDIEEVLYEHPSVKEVAAAGLPDEHYGEIVKVYIVLKQGIDVNENEIMSFCRERLAKYKVPKVVEFRSELPKTMVGKILRRALVEEEIMSYKERTIWVDRCNVSIYLT